MVEEAPLRRLRDLGHLGLGKQDHVAGDLLAGAGGDGQGGGQLGHPRAVGVPGRVGLRQPQLAGVEPGHRSGIGPEGGEGAAGAGKLGAEACLADRRQPVERIQERDQPARGLGTEARRHRLLEQRPGRHRGRPVGLGEPCRRGGGRVQALLDQPQGAPRDEHRRAVHDVLAGGTEMHVAGGVAGDRRPQLANERLDGIARPPSVLGQPSGVVELRPAAVGDRARRRGGHDPGRRLGRGQRPLGVQHRCQPGVVGDGIGQRAWHEQCVEPAHTTKNTVST